MHFLLEGIPIENQPKAPWLDMARMITTARITMPNAMGRHSAGRENINLEEQARYFMAGANPIFTGERLITTCYNDLDEDQQMFEIPGIPPREVFKYEKVPVA